ncbi:TetR/AcrR family transcriptional regulator [Herbiconiux sp. CPCC 205763]|uniref:TetR/AcrR family transcriptional regulator n=1 Tax=Herbiconiux aconitum TaxID=2970913 RepID=A0ABT2GN67_9MICO|nr:TetR/AcrR family transcriptional regulator [Herbiconiux aconitum]MCS5717669.1 TetR/AcrR family transcriptional regulator [Herbiconiux aconitum]
MVKSFAPTEDTRMAEFGTSESRGEARTVAILDAALELISEVGYERVTMDNIAARAHASKMTMYRRWPTKSELVAEALRRHAQGDVPSVPDTGTLRGDLLATVAEIAETLTGERGPSLIGLAEAIRDDAALREQVSSQVRERSHQVGREICARAVSRAEPVHANRAEAVLDLAFGHLFTATLFDGTKPSLVDQRSLVDAILLPLLSPTHTSAP